MFSSSTLGVAFVVLGFGAMFLMFHLWGYPYDKATRTSAAPRWAMWVHRVLGYLFAIVYVLLMIEMVPRLWQYQVEFPARTVVHMVVGFTIGFLLLIKIAIIRFFRHFEEWMPYLGTAIMLGTVVLMGLSLPFVLQERALAKSAPGGDALSAESRARVAQLLPNAKLPAEAPLGELASVEALSNGRDVLLGSCVKCHDLKTILEKPRTPSGWWNTVERMADKPALFAPMTEREMYEVTAYLIAITPDLQKASKQRHRQDVARAEAVAEISPDTTAATAALTTVITAPATTGTGPISATALSPPPDPTIDLARAKTTYEEVCAQCHELSEVDKAPPTTYVETREMVQRMIAENEAELTSEQIKLVAAWLDAHYVDKKR